MPGTVDPVGGLQGFAAKLQALVTRIVNLEVWQRTVTLGGAAGPTGTISAFAGASIPAGALACDGSVYDPILHAALFTAIGTTYGGSTSAPLLPLIAPGTNIVQQGSGFALAATGGEQTHTLTTAQMPSHNHGGSTSAGTSGGMSANDPHTHAPPAGDFALTSQPLAYSWSVSGGVDTFVDARGTATGPTSIAHTHTVPGLTITAQGGGGAHNNMPPYIAMAYVIWT
jgi:microcystin-dependent protein